MEITLKELRELRSTLLKHRLEHERLVTSMQAFRHECLKLRQRIQQEKQPRTARAETRA